MKAAKLIVGVLLAVSSLAACSSPPSETEIAAKLKTTTLKVTNSSPTATVILADQAKVASRWVWNATVNGKAFKCDVDVFFELPACEPATQSGA